MTGNITDLGMELGKMLYWNRRAAHGAVLVRHDRSRLKLAGGLIGMFVLGGVAGAVGFKYIGFVCVVPLAALLLALSVPPLIRDTPRSRALVRALGFPGWRAQAKPARDPAAGP
jgi:hypothetical protein